MRAMRCSCVLLRPLRVHASTLRLPVFIWLLFSFISFSSLLLLYSCIFVFSSPSCAHYSLITQVIEEVRDVRARQFLENFPFPIVTKDPSPAAMKAGMPHLQPLPPLPPLSAQFLIPSSAVLVVTKEISLSLFAITNPIFPNLTLLPPASPSLLYFLLSSLLSPFLSPLSSLPPLCSFHPVTNSHRSRSVRAQDRRLCISICGGSARPCVSLHSRMRGQRICCAPTHGTAEVRCDLRYLREPRKQQGRGGRGGRRGDRGRGRGKS